MTNIVKLAEFVDTAAKTAQAIPQLSLSGNDLTLEQAYGVQALSIGRRLQRGEQMVGVKMGFTSRAKMIQMGLSDLIWGRLTDAMRVACGGTIDFGAYVHPRVEPEIAFLLKHSLTGDVTAAEALAAVEGIAPALEIIDSRYENFKFNLSDVVADNRSSSSFVVGPWQAPDTQINDLSMVMSFDGKPVQTGSSAAILGAPIESLVAAARLAAVDGIELKAGWIVMAGGATAAEALKPGITVSLTVEKLGEVTFRVGTK
jgi:2-oxo-3-hexenedioate decarboxylase